MTSITSSSMNLGAENQEASSSSTVGGFSSLAKGLNFNLHVKLDNDNYISWKAQVLPIIKAFELEDFISGLKSIPPKLIETSSSDGSVKQLIVNEEYIKWNKSDQLLLSWLFSSINQTLIGQVIDCTSSFEVWSVLEKLFSQQSMAKVLQLKYQLQNVKKGSSTVSDFVLKVKTISESLRAVGQKVSEFDQILSILNGVGREYDAIVGVIQSQRASMSLQEASYLLMIHEQRMAQLDSVGQIYVP